MWGSIGFPLFKRVPPFCVSQLRKETVLHYVGNERLGSMQRKLAHCSFVTVRSVAEILHQFLFSLIMWALRNDTFQLRCAAERVIEPAVLVIWQFWFMTLRSRRRRCTGHVAIVGKQGMCKEMLWEIAWIICHSENAGGNERITLRWVLGKQVFRVGNGQTWLKVYIAACFCTGFVNSLNPVVCSVQGEKVRNERHGGLEGKGREVVVAYLRYCSIMFPEEMK